MHIYTTVLGTSFTSNIQLASANKRLTFFVSCINKSSSSYLKRYSKATMDQKIETMYRQIFADLTLDADEADDLKDFFNETNPPPDKLVWLRGTAFRIACEFLGDDHDTNVNVLRTVNAIVHALEFARMV
jgi:hypothetical protein